MMEDELKLLYDIIKRLRGIRTIVDNITYTIMHGGVTRSIDIIRNYIEAIKDSTDELEKLVERVEKGE